MNTWSPYQVRERLSHLTERDLRILEDVERFRLLGTAQIRRLQFGEGHASALAATRGAIRVLGRLEGHGYVSRLERRIGGARQGSTGSIWQLTATGDRLLRARRGDPQRRQYVEPTPAHTAHTLAIAELGVRLVELGRTELLDLSVLQTEPDCWRAFVGKNGAATFLKPDLYAVTADAEFDTHTYFEVDLSTEHLPTLRRKCEVYQRYFAAGIDQERLGLFPGVIWVMSSPERAERLRTAINEDPGLEADLFDVATATNVLEVLAPPGDEASAPTHVRRNYP